MTVKPSDPSSDPNDIIAAAAEARLSLLELDDVPNKRAVTAAPTPGRPVPPFVMPAMPATPPVVVAPVAPAPVAARAAKMPVRLPAPRAQRKQATKPITTEAVSAPAKALATEEATLAKDLGFDLTSTDDGLFYTAGTELMDIGVEVLRREQERYRQLPTLAEVAEQHALTIAAEQRVDIIRPVHKIGLNAIGKLYERGNQADGGVAIADQAFEQLTAFRPKDPTKVAKGRKGRQMRDLGDYPADKPLPAHTWNVNAWLPTVAPTKEARVRVRSHRSQREAYAIFTSSKKGFVPFDTDKLLAEAKNVIPDIKVDLTYDADTTRMRARCIKQAPIDIPSFIGVGRVHQIGFDITAGDNGSAGICVKPLLIRVRCRNATLVQYGSDKVKRFRHVGSYLLLREAMLGVLEEAASAVTQMAELWARAAGNHYLDTESGLALSVDEAIARLIEHGYLPTGGLSVGDAHGAYMNAWGAEDSPTSAQGVLMAVQRAAREGSWRTKWADDEIEEAASQLLYSTMYRLDAREETAVVKPYDMALYSEDADE